MPTVMRIGSAISGLLLVLFLVVHLAGLLPALIAPLKFELYATTLHHQPWLPLLEVSLATTATIHLVFTVAKTLRNRRAGNTAALRSRRGRPLAALATVAATWMRSAGVRMIVGVAFRVLENVARFVIRRMLGGR